MPFLVNYLVTWVVYYLVTWVVWWSVDKRKSITWIAPLLSVYPQVTPISKTLPEAQRTQDIASIT